MTSRTAPPNPVTSLFHRLRASTGVSLALCDQCGACSEVCPVAGGMDLPPSRLLRLAQMGFGGFDRRVLTSQAIWRCTGCNLCARHCPHGLDLPRAVTFFRWESERLGWSGSPGARRRPAPHA